MCVCLGAKPVTSIGASAGPVDVFQGQDAQQMPCRRNKLIYGGLYAAHHYHEYSSAPWPWAVLATELVSSGMMQKCSIQAVGSYEPTDAGVLTNGAMQ